MQECIESDVLILGCGIAGATAALRLADSGISVVVATSAASPEESNTYYAQGGIIYRGIDDSPELLAEDIIQAGAGYNNPEAVKILANMGPDLVKNFLIDNIAVPFDRSNDGELATIKEAAHSSKRILHAADSTGKAIETTLIKKIRQHPYIHLLTECTAVDLLTPGHHARNRIAVYQPQSCVGAYLLDQKKGRVIRCLAKKTILATGGLGQIYLQTTNPSGARGDGIAMAYRAGARVINSEFVQFHPTAFSQRNAPHFLITEAVRGAGARLVHDDGSPFMQHYDSKWKDLAPRDVVSRSIHKEMIKKNIPNVYLDLSSYIDHQAILEHFPSIYESCMEYGVDITKELVPVVPSAHYFCGGVWVDEWGKTTIQDLYAVGEVACTGLHGANRLGSASLLEGLVWGARIVQDITPNLNQAFAPIAEDIPPWQDLGSKMPDPALIQQDMHSIQNIMWNYVGLVRTASRLERAMRELRHLEFEIERFYRVRCLTDELIGLRNAVRTASIVTAAAWANKVSVGCHYRE